MDKQSYNDILRTNLSALADKHGISDACFADLVVSSRTNASDPSRTASRPGRSAADVRPTRPWRSRELPLRTEDCGR